MKRESSVSVAMEYLARAATSSWGDVYGLLVDVVVFDCDNLVKVDLCLFDAGVAS